MHIYDEIKPNIWYLNFIIVPGLTIHICTFFSNLEAVIMELYCTKAWIVLDIKIRLNDTDVWVIERTHITIQVSIRSKSLSFILLVIPNTLIYISLRHMAAMV